MSSYDDMPGMASDEQLEELSRAKGIEAEILFLELMIDHHQGGVEMAEAVLPLTERTEVTYLADTIVAGQQGRHRDHGDNAQRPQGALRPALSPPASPPVRSLTLGAHGGRLSGRRAGRGPCRGRGRGVPVLCSRRSTQSASRNPALMPDEPQGLGLEAA